MNEFEAKFLLFTDSIFGNIVLYPHNEFVLFTMQNLGDYNMQIAYLIVSVASVISISINYLFGKILYKIYIASMDSSKLSNFKQLVIYFKKYGNIILLFNILPIFGLIIPLLAGFVGFRYSRSVIICTITKMLFYAICLFL